MALINTQAAPVDDLSPPRSGTLQPPPIPPQFVIDVFHGPYGPVLQVSGELDIATAPLLTAMLDHVRDDVRPLGSGPGLASRPVMVDLSGVGFADSHGLAAVLDDRVVVLAASACVARVLRLLQPAPSPTAARRSGSASDDGQLFTGPGWAADARAPQVPASRTRTPRSVPVGASPAASTVLSRSTA